MRRVDFKAGALPIFYKDSLYKPIKGIPQIRKWPSFEANSVHVLKYNFFVFKYFFIIFYLRHQKFPPLQKTFSDWIVLSKLKIRITKKNVFFMLNPQIRPLRLLNLVNPLYTVNPYRVGLPSAGTVFKTTLPLPSSAAQGLFWNNR